MTDQAIDRARVLGAFRQLPEGVGITTLGLAWLVQCAEYRVRAAVSWLMLGGLVEPAGEHRRRDLPIPPKVDSHSSANWTPDPPQTGRLFQVKLDSRSEATLGVDVIYVLWVTSVNVGLRGHR